MTILCEMEGVHGGDDGYAVELWRNEETGRLVVRAYNEAGFNFTEIDLFGLVDWLSLGQREMIGKLMRDNGIAP